MDCPGAQLQDGALSKARFEFRRQERFNAGVDLDIARAWHDEALPKEAIKAAPTVMAAIGRPTA